MKTDPTCLYAQSHEWIRLEGAEGVVGVSDYAQQQLSDVVYVELPEPGDSFAQGEHFATVESVKTAGECYLPMSGAILEVNEELGGAPQLVNEDPYGAGWFVRVKVKNPSEAESLMSAEAYEQYCATLAE